MKTRMIISLFVVGVIVCGSTVHARRMAPPEVVLGKSANGNFEVKTETRLGKVSVFKAGDRGKMLWQLEIPNYGAFFSKILIADSGDYLVHLRGNYQVGNLEDVGIQVFTNDGHTAAIAAKEFIDDLVKVERPTSVDPQRKWVARVEAVLAESFAVINAKGEKKVVQLKDLKLKPL